MTGIVKRLVLSGVVFCLLACGCTDKDQGPRMGGTARTPQPFLLPSNKGEAVKPGASKHLTPPGN
jgi:hypothetical protein